MTTIHLSPKTAVAASDNSTNSANTNPDDLAGLQRKMADLMKALRDASKDTSPGAKDHMKLLQVEIQACEMQIEQVQQAATHKAQSKKHNASNNTPLPAGRKAAPGAIGNIIDTTA